MSRPEPAPRDPGSQMRRIERTPEGHESLVAQIVRALLWFLAVFAFLLGGVSLYAALIRWFLGV